MLVYHSVPLWKIWVRQWERWHPIYYGKYKSHVPNHQPDNHSSTTYTTCRIIPRIVSLVSNWGCNPLTHRIHGACTYANNWGILMVNVSIYSSTMDPMDYLNHSEVTNEPLTTPRTTPDPPGTTPQGPQPAASNADIPQFILLEKLGTIVNLA